MKSSQPKNQYSQWGKWQCVKQCGACCNLTPEERPELETYLSTEELDLYMSMVGTDGWCINYDSDTRECRIYEQRPSFCRVQPDNFAKMYGVEATEFNEFAIACCQEQIIGVYGENSQELSRYEQQVLGESSID